MNNLFIDGSMDDSLFLDDIPGLLIDCEDDACVESKQCGRDVKCMGKKYAYSISDEIFPVSNSAAVYADTITGDSQTSAAAAIGFKNYNPMRENDHIEVREENAEPTHCVGRSADCGDWLTMPDDIAPYIANTDEKSFSDNDQAEHLSKMVGYRMRAELTTQNINSRIVEGRLTDVNENFLMIEQPDTGASIAYDMNLFKYFMFLPEAMVQEQKARANLNANKGIRKQHKGKNRFLNNAVQQNAGHRL